MSSSLPGSDETYLDCAGLDEPYIGAPAGIIPLQYHANMLLDQHRMDSFQQAVAEVVRPGMRVLELGAGTGVLSYFAASRGASVVSVEREPVVLAAARSALATAPGVTLEVAGRSGAGRAAGCGAGRVAGRGPGRRPGAPGPGVVRLVHADAREYLPDEPVDVVICEMLHVGLFRERQVEVIGGFKERYLARFGGPLPRFLPEACVQAVQPVQQDFTFHGYRVAAPLFQDAFAAQPRTTGLAEPQVFQQFWYDDPLPVTCAADLEFTAEHPGELNAARIVTRNVLAGRPTPPGSVTWLMNYLVVPLPEPVAVDRGERVRLRFAYRPGDEIGAFGAGVDVVVGRPSEASAFTSGVLADARAGAWSLGALDALDALDALGADGAPGTADPHGRGRAPGRVEEAA